MNEGYKRLAFAIVLQTVTDYNALSKSDNSLLNDITQTITGGGYIFKMKQHKAMINELKRLENWFYSPYCDMLLQDKISADNIIKSLHDNKKADRQSYK